MMIEWRRLPRGSYTTTVDGRTHDVWQVGGGWRWSTLQADGRTYDGGGLVTGGMDEACEASLTCPHIGQED